MSSSGTTAQQHRDHHESHVHFNPEQVSHHDLEILVEPAGPGHVDVHLGFLQVDHVYEVDVPIAHCLGSEVATAASDSDAASSLFVRLKSHRCMRPECNDDNDAAASAASEAFSFELYAHKERLMRETLVLRGADPAARLAVQFHARVLGKHKGTPALKNGIRCVGIRSEDEGDSSDWQGFD